MRKLLAATCLTPLSLTFLPALAGAETVISTAVTTPVLTSTGNDDVRISSTGSVKPTSGAAVTIDSNDSVKNEGTIQITGANNSTGILANTGLTGNITNAGTITIDESYTATDSDSDADIDGAFAQGTGRYGIHVLGGGTFTGNIVNGGNITVEGNQSAAIAIDSTLAGNISLTGGAINVLGNDSVGLKAAAVTGNVALTNGTISVQGANAVGVQLSGDIGGALVIQNTINSTGYRSTVAPADPSKLDADDLLQGGSEIFASEGVQLGIGMSQEIDSNMALRGLMWSFGAGIQDENENVIINSDATVAAIEYMNELFANAMTPEVFAWNAASNNQGINSGELSYILNSISAYRTAQDEGLEVADDIWFTPALEGPETAVVASHVMYNWLIPDAPEVNVSAAQEFLLHYTENLAPVAWNSKLYDFPAFPERVPDLDSWLDDDPFGSNPPTKLQVLKDSLDWATNIGHPGPANPAIGQIFGESIIPVMFAEAAQGNKTPAEAVADAEAQINAIFDDWRGRGLVGSG